MLLNSARHLFNFAVEINKQKIYKIGRVGILIEQDKSVQDANNHRLSKTGICYRTRWPSCRSHACYGEPTSSSGKIFYHATNFLDCPNCPYFEHIMLQGQQGYSILVIDGGNKLDTINGLTAFKRMLLFENAIWLQCW